MISECLNGNGFRLLGGLNALRGERKWRRRPAVAISSPSIISQLILFQPFGAFGLPTGPFRAFAAAQAMFALRQFEQRHGDAFGLQRVREQAAVFHVDNRILHGMSEKRRRRVFCSR